jgi:hypothetical protein
VPLSLLSLTKNTYIDVSIQDDPKAEAMTFEANEVYAVNVAVSSGEGKPKEGRASTSVFKRAVDKVSTTPSTSTINWNTILLL